LKRVLEVLLDGEGTVGGTQRHVAQILDALDPSKYHASVVTWDIPDFVGELEERGVGTLRVSSPRIIDWGLIERLAAHMREGAYDLVHTHGHRAGLLGRIAALRAGVDRQIWTCHLPDNKADSNPILSACYSAALRWLGNRTDLTVAVSPYLKEWLVARGMRREQIEVVRNCVDLDDFHPAEPEPGLLPSLGLEQGRPVVGTVGRLTPQKGIDWALSASRLVLESHPEAQFLFVGGGPEEEALRRRAEHLGVEANVVFAGQRTDIPRLMAAFDVVIVPSRSEGGFSFVPLEAMACRKPVICSDIPPFIDVIVSGKNGIIVPLDSVAELARAIVALLDDPDEARRLAQDGYDLVRREFALSVMQAHMVEIYERVAAD